MPQRCPNPEIRAESSDFSAFTLTTSGEPTQLEAIRVVKLGLALWSSQEVTQAPDQIYIHNPNMLYALAQTQRIGTIRECFVVNQLSVKHTVEYGKTVGDFKIDGRITIEVGGNDKSFDKIADVPDSYIFADNMEFPVGKKLPLWLAGFTY